MKAVEILINTSGQITINATGFSGTECEKATAFLEQVLGEITARQRKPEWHQRNRRTTQQRIGV